MNERREMWQRRLGDWLDHVKKREILQTLEEYTHYIVEMTDLFVEAMDSLIKDKNITIQVDLISEREEEADIDAKKLMNEIIPADLDPSERGEILGLIYNLEQIADEIKRLGHLLELPAKPSKKMEKELRNIAKASESCLRATCESVIELNNDYQKAIAWAEEAARLQGEIDALSRIAYRELFSEAQCIDPSFLITRDLINKLEFIGDLCEKTADNVRIISLTHS